MRACSGYRKALVVLTADVDAENALRSVLGRWRSLGIRQMEEGRDFDLLRHPQRDAGCRSDAEAFLQGFVRTHGHAVVVFDHHGCGWENHAPEDVETELESRLSRAGWKGRCAAVVIAPELEAWVWSDSPHVASELGWSGRQPELQEWLRSKNLLAANQSKPADPKKAMEQAMRSVRKPLSPYVFASLAQKVSLNRCEDRAFLKLKDVLRQWFPAEEAPDCVRTATETK